MSVIALGSVRSCGVTTTAAGLAMVWPGEMRRVLIEADPAGGTLAAACALSAEPGLVSLAAAARREAEPALVFSHAQRLPDGTPVVCAPAGGERARSALSMLGPVIGRLAGLDAMALVDCGRLEPKGPRAQLFDDAQLSVLVCRPQLGDLNALAVFLESQPTDSGQRLIVLVGAGAYPSGEIADTLGLEVAGHLPLDPGAAALLMTQPPSVRRLTRTPLVRALRTLAETLAARTAESDDPNDRSGRESAEMIEVAR